jgi:very-short-patch-repair endonuclease
LLAAGLSRHVIAAMRTRGQLIERLPGVYAVGHAAPTELARETEALLASSMPASLCQFAAAALWGWRPRLRSDEPVDIVFPSDTVVRHPGIRSHRTKHLDRKDIRIHRGLPVTSPARTLLDVAPLVSDDELEHMLDEALERKLVRISQIRETIDRYGAGRPGVHRLIRVIDERDGRHSALSRFHAERRLRRLLIAAGIAPDETNVDLDGSVPDMVWREAKLIVEIDGWEHHRSRDRFEGDRRKDALRATRGWLTLRFTGRRIRDEPCAVIAEIALMLGRRLQAASA